MFSIFTILFSSKVENLRINFFQIQKLKFQVDLRHIDEENGRSEVEIGVDLTEFYMSVEWDILEVPAIRNVKYYTCCDEPYLVTASKHQQFFHISETFKFGFRIRKMIRPNSCWVF